MYVNVWMCKITISNTKFFLLFLKNYFKSKIAKKSIHGYLSVKNSILVTRSWVVRVTKSWVIAESGS